MPNTLKTVSHKVLTPDETPGVSIGISDRNREAIVEILNTTLADEFVLYTKVRNFHWNVVGRQFHELHRFFDEQYQELNLVVDEVAERARSLGGTAFGSLVEFLRRTRLTETIEHDLSSTQMVALLLNDHETMVRNLRDDAGTCDEKYKDAGTNDFLIGLLKQHEKTAWMLRALLMRTTEEARGMN